MKYLWTAQGRIETFIEESQLKRSDFQHPCPQLYADVCTNCLMTSTNMSDDPFITTNGKTCTHYGIQDFEIPICKLSDIMATYQGDNLVYICDKDGKLREQRAKDEIVQLNNLAKAAEEARLAAERAAEAERRRKQEEYEAAVRRQQEEQRRQQREREAQERANRAAEQEREAARQAERQAAQSRAVASRRQNYSYPGGSWSQSCQARSFDSDSGVLYANCRTMAGTWRYTTKSVANCSRFANINGDLQCE